MQPAVEQQLRLLQQRPRQNHHPRCPVSNFLVLRSRQLDEELSDLVLHLHALQDRRAIVGHAHLAVAAHKDLVHACHQRR